VTGKAKNGKEKGKATWQARTFCACPLVVAGVATGKLPLEALLGLWQPRSSGHLTVKLMQSSWFSAMQKFWYLLC
jgi:hypothetical protein